MRIMERPQFVLCQLFRHTPYLHIHLLLLLTIETSLSCLLLQLVKFGLQAVLACHLVEEASEVGSLLRGNLCGGGVGRSRAVPDGENAVIGAVHMEKVYVETIRG